MRRILIELAGRRPIVAAVPALVKAAADTDGPGPRGSPYGIGSHDRDPRSSAARARVANSQDADDAAAAAKALGAACQRMPDREACAGGARGRDLRGGGAGKVPLPGDPQRRGRNAGLADGGGRGQGCRSGNPGHGQPNAGGMDGRGRLAGAVGPGQERGRPEVQDPCPARLHPAVAAIRGVRRPAGGDVPQRSGDRSATPRRNWSWKLWDVIPAGRCSRRPWKRPRPRN